MRQDRPGSTTYSSYENALDIRLGDGDDSFDSRSTAATYTTVDGGPGRDFLSCVDALTEGCVVHGGSGDDTIEGSDAWRSGGALVGCG